MNEGGKGMNKMKRKRGRIKKGGEAPSKADNWEAQIGETFG